MLQNEIILNHLLDPMLFLWSLWINWTRMILWKNWLHLHAQMCADSDKQIHLCHRLNGYWIANVLAQTFVFNQLRLCSSNLNIEQQINFCTHSVDEANGKRSRKPTVVGQKYKYPKCDFKLQVLTRQVTIYCFFLAKYCNFCLLCASAQ